MKKYDFLLNYIKVADIHAARLNESLQETLQWMPITATDVPLLSSYQCAFIDMMGTRFAKLQDIIGSKIFPLILNLLQEDAVTFIDKLHKLEKFGYINSADWWIDFREMRNQLAHDYPDNAEQIATHLAALVLKADELTKFWTVLREKIGLISICPMA